MSSVRYTGFHASQHAYAADELKDKPQTNRHKARDLSHNTKQQDRYAPIRV